MIISSALIEFQVVLSKATKKKDSGESLDLFSCWTSPRFCDSTVLLGAVAGALMKHGAQEFIPSTMQNGQLIAIPAPAAYFFEHGEENERSEALPF